MKSKRMKKLPSAVEKLMSNVKWGTSWKIQYDYFNSLYVNKLYDGIPKYEELKGTIFFKYYKEFYSSREGLIMMNILSQDRSCFLPPFRNDLIRDYNHMDTKSEKILEKYPWLIGYKPPNLPPIGGRSDVTL